jgi:CTP-dependent riboflavin kinase
MFYRMFGAAALTLTLLVGSPALAKDVADRSHDGKVVSITNEKLTMTDKDGKEHSHVVAADSKVCLDGKAIKIADLKAGMRIRVTTKSDSKDVAARIEAIESNRDFSSWQDGKVVSMTGNKLVMTNKDGKEVASTLSENAKITIDGKESRFEDLKEGTRIRVTVLGDGKLLTSNIEAIVKNVDFEKRS